VRLTVAVLDAFGNAGCRLDGTIELMAPASLGLPDQVRLGAGEGGCLGLQGVASEEGLFRVGARGPDGLVAISNPLHVSPGGRRILWGDLHGHSNLSDGTGVPEDYYRYARDVAGLDVSALTDHDHWGFPFLDASPERWQEVTEQTRAFHEPGRFVTLLGYEWTNWVHGHRHVLLFEDEGRIASSLDPATDDPRKLWQALEGRAALTMAHHSAGGPVATNWSFAPDPRFEPVTEVVSVHGSSEAADSPLRIAGAVEGNFVRDALDRGYRLGFLGSGDSHDGHPGLAQLAGAGHAGLAAILAEDCTREAVLAALRARRTYATSGPRIVLRATLDGQPMGSDVKPGTHRLVALVVGTQPLQSVELVRSGMVVDAVSGEGREELAHEWTLSGLETGEYVYLRVTQVDLGMAWSSPFFVE
jgi:hypothetical protein